MKWVPGGECPCKSHQPPEVNYSPCFENDDLPCRVKSKTFLCRMNQGSRNRVDSSLQVVGGGHLAEARSPSGRDNARCQRAPSSLRGRFHQPPKVNYTEVPQNSNLPGAAYSQSRHPEPRTLRGTTNPHEKTKSTCFWSHGGVAYVVLFADWVLVLLVFARDTSAGSAPHAANTTCNASSPLSTSKGNNAPVSARIWCLAHPMKVDISLPGKHNSISHGARQEY